MVLQRDVAVPIWGSTATQGLAVDVSIGGAVYHATADASSHWAVALPPTPYGGPYSITVNASDGSRVVLTDVLFGELYLCSGQCVSPSAG